MIYKFIVTAFLLTIGFQTGRAESINLQGYIVTQDQLNIAVGLMALIAGVLAVRDGVPSIAKTIQDKVNRGETWAKGVTGKGKIRPIR